jgi:hypothetical protein
MSILLMECLGFSRLLDVFALPRVYRTTQIRISQSKN